MAARQGSARWEGSITEGSGTVSVGSKTLSDAPYSFSSRFADGSGTNPEELIGAAHAGCFSMALSKILGDAGTPPTSIDTTADVSLTKTEAGFEISKILLTTEAEVPGLTDADFVKHAETAKANCPVSKALAGTQITLDASLR